MNYIILAAGKEAKSLDKTPKCLHIVNNKTVLEGLLSASESKNVNIVGGFEILQIMKQYPSLRYFYNEKWQATKSLYSLSKAFDIFNSDSFVSYSDLIHKSETFKLIEHGQINVFYDSLWETRYEERDLSNLEKLFDSKGDLLGEFSGLMFIPDQETDYTKSLTKDLIAKDVKATLSDLINCMIRDKDVNFIDVCGNWTELDSIQDIERFQFGTKAETLEELRSKLKQSNVLNQYTFTVEKYNKNQERVIREVQDNFNSDLLIVRSSALNEDTKNSSMAGNYESVLKVRKSNSNILMDAIEFVKNSYTKNNQKLNKDNQILIQPYLEDVTMSGVVFSKDLQTSSPYYCVNYDKGSDTESVTSGNGSNLNTFICYNDFLGQIKDKKLSKLIDAVKEIEKITKYDAIDVEFAFVASQLYILQVRPVAAKKDSVVVNSDDVSHEINRIKSIFDVKNIGLLGNKKAYGVMPDWNPAEIIGTNPRALSFDLYRFLITDDIWAKSRAFLGYKKINSPGLVSFGGKPYVDIQMSFNTFIPSNLSDELSSRLVDYFISKLEDNPHNHDKIEFLVAITAYDFTFDEKVKDLLNNGFNESECDQIVSAYKNLTQNIILGQVSSINEEINKTLALSQRRHNILGSNLDDIDKVFYLLDDCKEYGTLPFANLARCGFIGSILLRSLLSKGVIEKTEFDDFFKSIHTVAKEFLDDFALLAKKSINKEKFIEQYGHLRPGTYDITAKSYKDGFDEYINSNSLLRSSVIHSQFNFSSNTIDKINNEIARFKLGFDADQLIEFSIKSTEAREKAKFEFTKNISSVLDLISNIGQKHSLSNDDLSYLNLDVLLKYRNSSSRLNFKDALLDNILQNKSSYLLTCSLQLPELIFNATDVEMFYYPSLKPSFITNYNIEGEVVFLIDSNLEDIDNKIVFIVNADPGFDWIFSHNIKGLVTKYGGVASHMSIRCAEFDLPAAIGCGDKIFNNTVKYTKVKLDCANKKITGIK